VNDSTNVEQSVRDALHDAAEHAPLRPAVALADAPVRIPAARNRHRALAAACVVAIGVAAIVGAVVVTRDGDSNVRVASPANEPREVPVADLARADVDLEVFMAVRASDDETAAVRSVIEASSDVEHFSFVDHEAAWTEFASIFACNPELVSSIHAADLPASFRIVATATDSPARLTEALANLPGVESIEQPGQADSRCEVAQGDVIPLPGPSLTPVPSTTPPTLPPAGDPPADTTSARDAVVAAFTQAWDGTSSIEQRRAAMQGSDQLAGALDQARAGNETTIASMRAVLGDVTFVTPDRAAVVFHLEFDGGLIEPTQVGYAVLEDGAWRVSRETVCAMLSGVGGVSCPS
jgi:hypothetical protein